MNRHLTLRLVTQLSGRAWQPQLGRFAEAGDRMAQDTSAPRTTSAGPDQGSGEQEPAPGHLQPGESGRRVPLDRLLSVVLLTPAQAALVAVQLLDATHLRGTTNGVRRAAVRLGTVTLTHAGDVEVGRPQADEGTLVTELLDQLCQNARRLPAHPKSGQLVLLRRLEEAAADPQLEPDTRARELEGALADVLGPGARQRLPGQLAALVDAFSHISPGVPVPRNARAAPGVSRTAPHRAAPTRSTPSRAPRRGQALIRRRARTRRTLLVVLLLTAALAGSGYVVLRNPDLGIAGALGRDDNSPAPSTPAPSNPSNEPGGQPGPDPRQDVRALAGRHAGPITGVEVQKADGCTPGALCPVTVTVRFRPSSATQPVVWKVGAARLCGSGITWSPPITVTAQPGWTSVYASSSIRVPQGRSLALVALTTTPARAQSPPVPVTGTSLRC